MQHASACILSQIEITRDMRWRRISSNGGDTAPSDGSGGPDTSAPSPLPPLKSPASGGRSIPIIPAQLRPKSPSPALLPAPIPPANQSNTGGYPSSKSTWKQAWEWQNALVHATDMQLLWLCSEAMTNEQLLRLCARPHLGFGWYTRRVWKHCIHDDASSGSIR